MIPASRLIPLRAWAKATYGDAAPCAGTLRRWAREGKVAGAEKHGREYFAPPDAHYVANDGAKPENVKPARRCIEREEKASDLLEQMIHGRKKKAA